jgi:hypothetical protein
LRLKRFRFSRLGTLSFELANSDTCRSDLKRFGNFRSLALLNSDLRSWPSTLTAVRPRPVIRDLLRLLPSVTPSILKLICWTDSVGCAGLEVERNILAFLDLAVRDLGRSISR